MHYLKCPLVRINIFIITLAILTISSCKKIEQLLSFNIRNECSFRVSSVTPVSSPFDIITPDVPTQSQQEFANNKTSVGLVKDIRLSQMTLTITTPSGKTFGFLRSVHIYISTPEGQDEIELAYADNIDPNSSSIELTPLPAQLDKYVKASSYKLRTEVVTRQVVTENIDIRVNSTFRVTANI